MAKDSSNPTEGGLFSGAESSSDNPTKGALYSGTLKQRLFVFVTGSMSAAGKYRSQVIRLIAPGRLDKRRCFSA